MLAVILMLKALTVAVAGPPGSPEYLPLRVAEAHGDFVRESLTVTLRSTRSESGAAEALAQDQADLAATSLEAMLRFGQRKTGKTGSVPWLIFGLTAGPPVAVVVSRAHGDAVRSVGDLAGARVGFAAAGGSEQTWLQAVLARAQIPASRVSLVSLGSRGVLNALDAGEVHAAVVAEPTATALLGEDRARLLVDLRSPDAVRLALGTTTVNAAVFSRADRRLDPALAAFARALIAAERRIATAPPATLAEALPRGVVGAGDEFQRQIEATRGIYLRGGVVESEAVRATLAMIRAHLPLPGWLRVPGPDELLHLDPLRRALRSRPPA